MSLFQTCPVCPSVPCYYHDTLHFATLIPHPAWGKNHSSEGEDLLFRFILTPQAAERRAKS